MVDETLVVFRHDDGRHPFMQKLMFLFQLQVEIPGKSIAAHQFGPGKPMHPGMGVVWWR
ncbi:MAG: hypothetical protein JRJ85_03075 [Deltaproteobacteria bacterium]|nr:hypothetical protein [Deltaproteobacteria bacterium]